MRTPSNMHSLHKISYQPSNQALLSVRCCYSAVAHSSIAERQLLDNGLSSMVIQQQAKRRVHNGFGIDLSSSLLVVHEVLILLMVH